MKTERNSVFETNSSSTHSITLNVEVMMAADFTGKEDTYNWGSEAREIKRFTTPNGEEVIVIVDAESEEDY